MPEAVARGRHLCPTLNTPKVGEVDVLSPTPKKFTFVRRSFKTVVGKLGKLRIMRDERLVSKMEGESNFSRRLKQFDGLTWLTPTPSPYFTKDLRHCHCRRRIAVVNTALEDWSG